MKQVQTVGNNLQVTHSSDPYQNKWEKITKFALTLSSMEMWTAFQAESLHNFHMVMTSLSYAFDHHHHGQEPSHNWPRI